MSGGPVTTAPRVAPHEAWLSIRINSLGDEHSFALTPYAAMALLCALKIAVPNFIASLNTATVIKFPSAKKRNSIARARRKRQARS